MLKAFQLILLTFLISRGNPEFADTVWNKSFTVEPNPILEKQLRSLHTGSGLGGKVGISVISTKHQRQEVAIDDTVLYTPASCRKISTTASALHYLPLDFHPATKVEVRGKLKNGLLRGNLHIRGGGDPNVSARFYPNELWILEQWADSIKKSGIDSIDGSLILSDDYFTGPARPADWKSRHFDRWFGAEISAASYNDNCFLLKVLPAQKPGLPAEVRIIPEIGFVKVVNKATTTGGRSNRIRFSLDKSQNIVTITGSIGTSARRTKVDLPVRNPSEYYRKAWRHVLNQKGIGISDDSTGKKTLPVINSYRFTTVPLTNFVNEVNQRSQNLHAELLLRHVGKKVFDTGSASHGIAAESRFLAKMGLDSSDYHLIDGSGLSDNNQFKPRALALLLARMLEHPKRYSFVSSLSTPGKDGLHAKRLKSHGNVNRIKMKTGHIQSVQGLSGYIMALDGDTLAVSILYNDYKGSAGAASNLVDSLYSTITQWYNKEWNALAESQKLLLKGSKVDPYQNRLIFFSETLMGRDYLLGPTGEGRFAHYDDKPLVHMKAFDCVTYIESVAALALSKTVSEILPFINNIRYKNGSISYRNRNHFFIQDWVTNNSDLVAELKLPGSVLMEKPIDKISFFSKKQMTPPDSNPVSHFYYLPYEKAVQFMAGWDRGEKFWGVAFVTDIKGLDVTHTGFLIADQNGPPRLRHASSKNKQVAEQNFEQYLHSRKGKCSGVYFFEFLPPGNN